MSGLTYDTGALIAADRGVRRVWLLHTRAIRRGRRPVVPAAALAQAWRGGPQPRLSQLLKGCRVDQLDELLARAAGTACGAAGTADIVDASVVVGAIRRQDACVTSDPDDLAVIAAALGRRLQLFVV